MSLVHTRLGASGWKFLLSKFGAIGRLCLLPVVTMNLRFPRVLMLCSCEPPDSLFPNFAHYPAQSTPSLFLECRALFILASSAPSRVNSICSALTGLAPALANWPFAACRTHFLMSDSASPELWLSPRMIDALNQSHRFQFVYLWWVWLDSNQRPRDYETQPFDF